MQIENLKIFADLVETKSFSKSAKLNGITQSAVSQQISSLERQFKSLLIERSKKKFRLTREGQPNLFIYKHQISAITEVNRQARRSQRTKEVAGEAVKNGMES